LEGLASLYDLALPERLKIVARALDAREVSAVVEAVQWIEQAGDNAQPEVPYFKYCLLAESSKHRNPLVKQTVGGALERLSALAKNGKGGEH
jgi:hypothetical protein